MVQEIPFGPEEYFAQMYMRTNIISSAMRYPFSKLQSQWLIAYCTHPSSTSKKCNMGLCFSKQLLKNSNNDFRNKHEDR